MQNPDQKNDFEDWDADSWVSVKSPYVPSFLLVTLCTLLVALPSAAFLFVKLRRGQISSLTNRFRGYSAPEGQQSTNRWL